MSEQVKKCIDLQHSLHWLHLEPTHRILPTVAAGAVVAAVLAIADDPIHYIVACLARGVWQRVNL
jgi:hypothetical protein